MILHFKSGHDHINVFFERGNYNFNIYPKAHYIDVSREDLDAIYQEIDFNCYWNVDDLTATHDTVTEEPAPFS